VSTPASPPHAKQSLVPHKPFRVPAHHEPERFGGFETHFFPAIVVKSIDKHFFRFGVGNAIDCGEISDGSHSVFHSEFVRFDRRGQTFHVVIRSVHIDLAKQSLSASELLFKWNFLSSHW
jgi:hypothetical protein